ncbi:MAG: hypothetical protein K8L91_01960 [Anaerolineae bacterium]|nr:hypothetical protein [Anaerolineae bacterium]
MAAREIFGETKHRLSRRILIKPYGVGNEGHDRRRFRLRVQQAAMF